MSLRFGHTWWKLSYFLEGIQMWTFKTQTFRKSVLLLVWIDSSRSVTARGMTFDREFPSQARPPWGPSERHILPYLPKLQSPEEDMTYLHTFNGLLSTPTDWGSPLTCLLLSCSIESTLLDSKEVFWDCREDLLSVRKVSLPPHPTQHDTISKINSDLRWDLYNRGVIRGQAFPQTDRGRDSECVLEERCQICKSVVVTIG